MCTVTIVRPSGGTGRDGLRLRVVTNRDENRSRSHALPPREVRAGGRRAVMPIDPASGGTWIGMNDAGLVVCLLNRTLATERPGPAHPRSRGEIIAGLLAARDVEGALAAAGAIDVRRFPLFRLVLAQAERTVVLASGGEELETQLDTRETGPVMVTSSGLGDHLVEGVRRELFVDAFAGSGEVCGLQDRFHAHHWQDRRHLSVLMSRGEARTVSRTVVEVREGEATMQYAAIDEAQRESTGVVRIVLPLALSRALR